MYRPDRVIARKIKEYDPYLFLDWNNEHGWFDLYREMPHGRRLITPVVRRIYDSKAPKEFVQLDERLLWLLYEWDSWRTSPKQHVLEGDQRWVEWNKSKDKRQKAMFRDLAKDLYSISSGFFATKHQSKNSKTPDLNRKKPGTLRPSIRPDVQTGGRLFQRSRGNALRFFNGK